MLARSAEPVLRHLHEQLDGQPISIILTDATGLVLRRLTGDRDLERQLDTIMLIPGFSYAEDVVGTNGIGTALESGGPTHVFGHEHYAERLEGMACAGVPLRDPLSGKTVGVIDLTCWRRDADPLMLSLVRSTADQLGQALTETSNGRDLRLLQEYTRACRHTGGIVLALGNDVVMLNDHARRALSPADQAALISQATETLSAEAIAAGARGRLRAPGAVTVDLPSGAVARMFCRPVGEFGMLAASADTGTLADGVVHVKLVAPAAPPSAEAIIARAAMALPGLVGSGAAWRRACRLAEASYERGEWLALEGEHGVGKLALVRAVHQRRNPAAPCHVLDAADAAHDHDWVAQVRAELLEGTGMLVLRHVHLLNARQVRTLAGALQEARDAERHHPPAGRPAGHAGGGHPRPRRRPGRPGRPAAAVPRVRGRAAAAPSQRGPARPGAVLPRQAEPAGPRHLLARRDAAAAAAHLAGERGPALAGAQAGGAAPQGRPDHAGGPAARVLDGIAPGAVAA